MQCLSWIIPLCLWMAPHVLTAQRGQGDLSILWYNVENLFHPDSDSLSVDMEFTPEGSRHWTHARYQTKLTALSKVILAAGGWEPPELVGLCEVEGAGVLDDLIAHPLLANYQYEYLHRDSPDHRGMDVACLYRPSQIDIWQWGSLASPISLGGTRDMMHVSLTFGKGDSLELFLIHFISKYRGAGATAKYRRIQTGHLLHCIDSVHALRPRIAFMLAGDFNDAPGSYSLEKLQYVPLGEDSLQWIVPALSPQVAGTYKYRAHWSHLDQMYFGDPMERFAPSASVLVLSPLLWRDEEYGKMKPRRTYHGYRYEGGISDHLPLVGFLRRTRRPSLLGW